MRLECAGLGVTTQAGRMVTSAWGMARTRGDRPPQGRGSRRGVGPVGVLCAIGALAPLGACSVDRSPALDPSTAQIESGVSAGPDAGPAGSAGTAAAGVSAAGVSAAGVSAAGAGADCVDLDGDGFGTGAGCQGLDCDDQNAAVNPTMVELCNTLDEDCDGLVDEAPSDCGSGCRQEGSGYARFEGGACVDGVCQQGAAESCGAYTCGGGGESGEQCAVGCEVNGASQDGLCRADHHCKGQVCEPDRANGQACDVHEDCASGHCNNGLCCDSDVCCLTEADCGGGAGVGLVCDDVEACQGTLGQILCENFRCSTLEGQPDDSGCSAGMEADDCGLYRATRCEGGAEQTPPRCLTRCTFDSQCDENAHCEAFRCQLDKPDGSSCSADSDCISGHCSGGFCCQSGDCCNTAFDCPLRYRGSATCRDTSSCQGVRDIAVCENSRCDTVKDVENDSACSLLVLANRCGPYPDLLCTGAASQTAPVCATSCLLSLGCDLNAHCSAGACVPDLPGGSACTAAEQCLSGYCSNGFCCAGGDCCSTAADCPGHDPVGVRSCVDATSCTGELSQVVCNAESSCQTAVTADAAACDGVSRSCGGFVDTPCPSACPTACADVGDCDPGLNCTQDGNCSTTGQPGTACTDSGACLPGLHCVDGVCCELACDGPCQTCNASGRCVLVGAGLDPDDECAGVSCTGYHDGWSGNSCFGKADAGPGAVGCDGAGACQTAADVCPSQAAGPVVLTCDPLSCQLPAAATCAGTTAGSCMPDPSCPSPAP